MIHNPKNKLYCVYAHKRLDGSIFYIGCGDYGRPYNYGSRSLDWYNEAINGFTIDILELGIKTKSEALVIEDMYILKTPNLKQLTNRQNRGLATKGKIAHNRGKKMSEETRKKMSIARMGKSPFNKGKKLDLLTQTFK